MKIQHHPRIDYFILGLNFLQNYYTVFDQEKKAIAFAQSKSAPRRLHEITKEAQNQLLYPKVRNWLLIIGCLIVVICSIVLIYLQCQKQRRSRAVNQVSDYQSV